MFPTLPAHSEHYINMDGWMDRQTGPKSLTPKKKESLAACLPDKISPMVLTYFPSTGEFGNIGLGEGD